MSEIGRAARALVETRTERFESTFSLEATRERIGRAMERARPAGATVTELSWIDAPAVAVEVRYSPPASTQRLLKVLSIGMALAVAASAWAIAAEEGALRFLLPLFTVLAILAMPFVALGLGSRRAAEESRIARAIRSALAAEPEAPPARQRWDDEED
jgi:hypothetical protein